MKAPLITVFLLLFGLGSFAQDNRFETGLELGPNAARFWGIDMEDTHIRTRIGFAGGVFFQMNLNRFFSLRSHLSYEQKGFAYTMPLTDNNGYSDGTYSFRSNFHYVTYGLLARLSAGNKVKGFLNVGPYVSALVKETEVTSATMFPSQKVTNTDRFNPYDTGISTGIGLSFPYQTRFAISFEVRNNLGLYSISKSGTINGNTIHHVSNHFLLGLSYKLK